MNKLALTFCVFLGLTGVARAQQSELYYMPLMAVCLPTKTIDKELLTKYNEVAVAQGASVVYNSQLKDYMSTNTRIFLNTENNSFSVVVDVPKDRMSCVVISGDNFSPAQKKNRRL